MVLTDAQAVIIKSFLEDAIKEGWQMRPDQVTSDMIQAGIRRSPNPQDCYERMLAAAPVFNFKSQS